MSFPFAVAAFCDRFLAQRTFDLMVAPALADAEFEASTRRRGTVSSHLPVLRAVIGGVVHDARGGAPVFAKLALLSMAYFMFPIVFSGSYFESWESYVAAVLIMFLLSLSPVIVCFWPERHSRPSNR
jgi:hypothetical protein